VIEFDELQYGVAGISFKALEMYWELLIKKLDRKRVYTMWLMSLHIYWNFTS
jgi:hypothetical protein